MLAADFSRADFRPSLTGHRGSLRGWMVLDLQFVTYLFIALTAILAAIQIYQVYRREGLTPEGWEQIRKIIYEAIQQGLEIYKGAKLGLDQLVEILAEIIYRRLQGQDLPGPDRTFWTRERISTFIRPVIRELIAKSEAERATAEGIVTGRRV